MALCPFSMQCDVVKSLHLGARHLGVNLNSDSFHKLCHLILIPLPVKLGMMVMTASANTPTYTVGAPEIYGICKSLGPLILPLYNMWEANKVLKLKLRRKRGCLRQ